MRWVLIAITGGAACTVLDHLHATHDVLWYPRVFAWEQAWWVPLLFACASVASVAGAAPIRRALGGRPLEPPTVRRVAADAIGFIAAYAYTSFGHGRPNVVAAVLLAFFVARASAQPVWVIVYALLVAVCGTLFEAGWSSLGFFYYRHPDAIGVPRWLPGIYLHVALLTARLERLLRGGDERANVAA